MHLLCSYKVIVGKHGSQLGFFNIHIFIVATLMERGRHAAYILLTGPEEEGAEGTVVLSKRKLKQDVPDSRVLRLGDGTSKSSEEIKEAFNRLRFSDW